MDLDRRQLLQCAVVAGTTAALASLERHQVAEAADAADTSVRPWETIDVNVNLFRWPFRRLPYDTTGALIEKLQTRSIQQAWAGSYEALLHRDLAAVNARLAEACGTAPAGLLVPFGTVNPELPAWKDDLRRCHEEHQMPGIRLFPNYHGYTLSDERFQQLLAMATERGMLVQISASLEDPRTQHPQLHVADVDLAPLADLVAATPGARVMLLNAKLRGAVLERLAAVDRIAFDIARVEATDGIAKLIAATSPERVCFGTHAPFLIYEAALIRVYESQLSEPDVRRMLGENARRLLTTA